MIPGYLQCRFTIKSHESGCYGYSNGYTRTMATTRGKGEGSIYQQSDGLWAASIELAPGLDQKRRRKVIRRKSKAQLLKDVRALRKKLAENGDLVTGSMTATLWFTHWLENIVAPNARPKTYMGHRSVVNGHIIPAIGKLKLDKITPDHVRLVHQRIMATPKKASLRGKNDLPADTEMLSSSYAGTAHALMVTAFTAAQREGKLDGNPAKFVQAPKSDAVERKALSLEQAIKLLQHLATHPSGALWATYLFTGGRRGEIIGLEVDRVSQVLDLSWQLQRISNIEKAPKDYEYRRLSNRLFLTRPKSKAGWRIIPLVEPLKTILERHIENSGTTGLVFTREDGTPMDPDDVTEAWAKLLEDAGLPDDVVLHGSRHTTVDLLYEAGVPEAVIMEIVGHTTRAMTRGYKSRGNEKQLREAMEKMSQLFSAKPQPIEK